MKRSSLFLCLGLLATLLPAAVAAQDAKSPSHTYRITYTLTVIDGGKRTSSQHFNMTVNSNGSRATLKMGEKVPVVTGSYNSSGNTSQSQFTYLDIGLNLSALLTEDANGISLTSKVEQSSVAPAPATLPNDPVVRQMVLENTSLLTPGKPVTIGSLDVPDSNRHMDLEVVIERVP